MHASEDFANLIGGAFAPAVNGEWFDHVNPATGEGVGRIADSSLMDVVRALQAANQAFASLQIFLKTDPQVIQSLLLVFLERLKTHAATFARMQSLEQGTTLKMSSESVERALSAAARILESGASFGAVMDDAERAQQRTEIITAARFISPSLNKASLCSFRRRRGHLDVDGSARDDFKASRPGARGR